MGDGEDLEITVGGQPVVPPESQRERAKRLLGAEGALETICGHIANGGSTIDLAKTWAIRHSDLWFWLGETQERKDAHDHAQKCRDEWTLQAILKKLVEVFNVDKREAYNEWGTLKSVHEIPAHVMSAIKSIKTREEFDTTTGEREKSAETVEVLFKDGTKELELLAKRYMEFSEKHDVTSGGQAIQVVTGVPVGPEPTKPAGRLASGDIPDLGN